MGFRYLPKTVSYYVECAKNRIELIDTNIIGVRDQQLQTILEQLLELNYFLVNRLACVADNVYLPEGVEGK